MKEESHEITLQFPVEVRFTPTGKIVCRIYAQDDERMYYLWSVNAQLVDELIKFPIGTVLEVRGHEKGRTFTSYHDQKEITITEFIVSDWKLVSNP